MQHADEVRSGEIPSHNEWSKAQRAAVLEETDRILAHRVFRKSQRCVALLRRLVESSLAGEQENIKERTLGVEVFGRTPDYDSDSDPVVRMAASEVRKRLAMYYQQLDRSDRVKIRLSPGSYIPEFDFADKNRTEGADGAVVEHPQNAPLDQPRAVPWQRIRVALLSVFPRNWVVLGVLLVLLVIAVGLELMHTGVFRSTQHQIWAPMLQSKEPLVICLPDDPTLQSPEQGLTPEEKLAHAQVFAAVIESRKAPKTDPARIMSVTPFSDLNVAHQIANLLILDHGKASDLRPSSGLTMRDFHRGPIVLIGGLDNRWTLVLLSGLRFSLRADTTSGAIWVQDSQNPGKRNWQTSGTDDYGIITRFFDAETGNWIFAIGGLGWWGTEAASQLLLNPAQAKSLPSRIRSSKNFQMVVGTHVINGNASEPQILAVHTW